VEVKLGRHEGLPRDCVVNSDWLVTIPKDDLVAQAGALGGARATQPGAPVRARAGVARHSIAMDPIAIVSGPG
jgi:mRNA-degrading endonuclease toxin of MazEF toxin-antitoxin module